MWKEFSLHVPVMLEQSEAYKNTGLFIPNDRVFGLSSKKVWIDKIFAVVMKKRSIDNAVLP